MPKLIRPILPREDKLKSALVSTTGTLFRVGKSPDEELGELFLEVQKNSVYDDGKTFVDLVPRMRMKAILQEYRLVREDPDFELREFVNRHFYEFTPNSSNHYQSNAERPIGQHVKELWSVLERRNRRTRGSLLALPYAYVVPGGRFSEQFYWDSYFIMLGLATDERWDLIEGMVKNYSFMIRRFGFIPTANRSYFLSRSQPPFFSHMVRLLAKHRGRKITLIEYLPYMIAEYRFWMKGHQKLAKQEHGAFARVVQIPNGELVNRYYDNKRTPRPESLKEDIETVAHTILEKEKMYLHLRAGAESGWDFSSRWLEDPHDLASIHTTDIVPVDLNCLLYQLEYTIAETYQHLKNPLLAKKFMRLAQRREKTIKTLFWNETSQFFEDYNFHQDKHTGHLTLAAVFPLYAGVATKEQADLVAARIEKDFLKQGGLITTLVETGQQWDAPNGWAPLHWIVVEGLRHYGHFRLANEIKRRWVTTCMKVYAERHKLIEKYDVQSTNGLGGGGEYPLQDGFGWTNGVLKAFLEEDA